MTSKLKCPVCNHELYQTASECLTYCCLNKDCPSDFKFAGSKEIWQALIQTQKDLGNAKSDIEDYKKYKALWEQIRNNTILELERKLEIARKALDWIGNNRLAENPVRVEQLRRHARNALEQINRKED